MDLTICPECESVEVKQIDTKQVDKKIAQTMECINCGMAWMNIYTFKQQINITELKED